MPSTFMQAGKLLNESEFALFAASRAGVLNTLTKAGLAGKIRRARSLRDKYRDLLKRQRLATPDPNRKQSGRQRRCQSTHKAKGGDIRAGAATS